MKTYKNISKTGSWLLHNKNHYLYPQLMRVKILDNNQEFTAISNYDVVFFLWQNSFQKEATIEKFMLEYARRAVINNDENIRGTSVNEFVEDLEKYRHIVISEKPGLN
ncbi:hypothetical protein ABXT08_06985 [Chryseobacterium sp. NRRL B-14859]|uniref:hypothetical protein n=1 Tax=Chryseobacterium sp. NRRL B-14859 TaxID=1562763 RepID=UPI003395EDF0